MRLTRCCVKNFGSYENLVIDYSNTGLSLVYGSTGSGKSTLADAPSWVLFGKTAKDGNADDIRPWHNSDDDTIGTLVLEINSRTITVCRVRGSKNDLFWTEGEDYDNKKRGKDLQETQKLLCNLIGVDHFLYLSACYYCDFSPTGSFFVAKAKERRDLFEKIADLEMPTVLSERLADYKKETKKLLDEEEKLLARHQGMAEHAKSSLEDMKLEEKVWEDKHAEELEVLQSCLDNFEFFKLEQIVSIKEKKEAFEKDRSNELERLADEVAKVGAQLKDPETYDCAINDLKAQSKCKVCKGIKEDIVKQIQQLERDKANNAKNMDTYSRIVKKAEDIYEAANPFIAEMEEAELETNPHGKLLKEASQEKNPFIAKKDKYINNLSAIESNIMATTHTIARHKNTIADLDLLQNLSAQLRGELLKQAVVEIESKTNNYLDKHFDSEIKVAFSIDADNLLVVIQKSGYECSFKQLSKGQRQLLKLCFAVSVMSASANKAGIHFENLFFDEALDGLDSSLKIKAFDLFQELSLAHNSVFLIDHSPEFQNLFDNKFYVTMEADVSHVEHEAS